MGDISMNCRAFRCIIRVCDLPNSNYFNMGTFAVFIYIKQFFKCAWLFGTPLSNIKGTYCRVLLKVEL